MSEHTSAIRNADIVYLVMTVNNQHVLFRCLGDWIHSQSNTYALLGAAQELGFLGGIETTGKWVAETNVIECYSLEEALMKLADLG
jgi:hypothetical protein